jgi:type I restriction enzyme S subunit
MNARVIVDVDIVIPPDDVIRAYLPNILPLRQRLAASVKQSTALAAIRDALLPKLLSGEIRGTDAAKLEAVR